MSPSRARRAPCAAVRRPGCAPERRTATEIEPRSAHDLHRGEVGLPRSSELVFDEGERIVERAGVEARQDLVAERVPVLEVVALRRPQREVAVDAASRVIDVVPPEGDEREMEIDSTSSARLPRWRASRVSAFARTSSSTRSPVWTRTNSAVDFAMSASPCRA